MSKHFVCHECKSVIRKLPVRAVAAINPDTRKVIALVRVYCRLCWLNSPWGLDDAWKEGQNATAAADATP